MNKLRITLIEAKVPSILAKTYELGSTQELVVKRGGQVVEGTAVVHHLETLEDLVPILKSLQTNQALAYGLPPMAECRILSEERWRRQSEPDVFTRSRAHFRFDDGPGVMFLDYDPAPGVPALSREELAELLRAVCPGILSPGAIWWTSSSSHIMHGEKDLTGLRGQRLYIPVASAADTPRALAVLVARLWLAGQGFIQISKSGTLLERTGIDGSTGQPERLDFAAGARCLPPLRQERGEPFIFAGDGDSLLDTRKVMLPLSPAEEERCHQMILAAKRAAHAEAQSVKDQYVAARVKATLATSTLEPESVRKTWLRALESRELGPEFKLTVLQDGEERTVSVDDVLRSPDSYDRLRALDPLEPDLYGRQDCAVLYLNPGDERLHSFGHGGCSFRLCKKTETIVLRPGNTHEVTDAVLVGIRVQGDLFDRGYSLVRVASDGKVQVMDRHSLGHYLGHRFSWKEATIKGGLRPKDPPYKVSEQILSLGASRGLRELDQVLTAPIILPCGRVLSEAGYDAPTRLYLSLAEGVPAFNRKPSQEEVLEAVNRIWIPVELFPFVGPVDRGVFLAAILTAVTRPGMDLAPAFGIDAAEQGSGKTLLARSLGAIAIGRQAVITPHVSKHGEEEIRKRIFAKLLEGAPLVVWDNVVGKFDSAAFASMLTAPVYSDRLLGVSETAFVPARAMWVITGNNLTPAGDMPRRMAITRIEPRVTDPFSRVFDLDPERYCMEHRARIVRDAITLMLGYLGSGATPAEGRVPTFEVWDGLVRQTVAWLSGFDKRFADPAEAFRSASLVDPQREQDGMWFAAIYAKFQETEFQSEDLMGVVLRVAARHDSYPAMLVSAVDIQLAHVLLELSPNGRANGLNTRMIGDHLRYRNGRMASGLRLIRTRVVSHVARWKVVLEDPTAYPGAEELVAEAEACVSSTKGGAM